MSVLYLRPEERRRAFWSIEDTTAADLLQVSVGGSDYVPLLWGEDENWYVWVEGPDSTFGDAVQIPYGMASATVRAQETGEVLLFEAGAIYVQSACNAWPVDWSACASVPQDADIRERAETLAITTLQALTLGRVGGCPITVRPCAQGCLGDLASSHGGNYRGAYYPHVGVNGRWVNSCGCARRCHCGSAMSEVVLELPVGRVDEVWVDGVLIDSSLYRVDDGYRLVRLDGELWPSCQDLTQPFNGPDAFSVTYLNAYPVTYLGAVTAGVLAAEYAKACSGKGCALPSGVTSISRQGVSMEIRYDMFADGLTGVREVDVFTAQYNPNRLRVRPRVYSPDLVAPLRTTLRTTTS